MLPRSWIVKRDFRAAEPRVWPHECCTGMLQYTIAAKPHHRHQVPSCHLKQWSYNFPLCPSDRIWFAGCAKRYNGYPPRVG